MAETKVSEGAEDSVFLQALSAEFSMLQGTRGATISESSSRSSLYMTTLSGAVVALALVAQAAKLRWQQFLSAAATVAIVNSVVGGVFFALMVAYFAQLPPIASIATGAILTPGLAVVFLGHSGGRGCE